jgi:sodium-dependent phosphate transporter
MPRLTQYNYVFAIGTFFALLDAYNNGASKCSLRPLPRTQY